MREYSLQGLNVGPGEFLGAFYTHTEDVCLRVFSDRADSAFAGQKTTTKQGMFDSKFAELQKHNALNRGIFFVVNYGGHEDADIKRVNAQFCEMDDIPLEEQLARVKDFPLEPSLVVKTRKSLHCYWLIKRGSVENFRRIQRGLIAHFGADPACVNESRVFRLPGFNHCKGDATPVLCVKFNPEIRYTQQQLEAFLPAMPDEPVGAPAGTAAIKNRGRQKGLVVTGKRCSFISHCKRNAKTLSEPDWYAMITNLALFEGGEDAIHKLSRPYPGYSPEQTQAKIDHFHRSGTKPMTCARIAERGFKCPKLKKGCACKSPAGWAFIPMTTDELQKALVAVKAKKDPAADIHAARAFIETYLFNVEPSVAVVFINNNIKAHFGFKAADIKELPVFHRNTYAAFSSTQEARRDKNGTEIPPWYYETDRGSWKLKPGILANHLADTEPVVYCAESYYFYNNGVYRPQTDDYAQARVRDFLNPEYCTMADISDAERQWHLCIMKTDREINVNPYLMNFKNGLYDLLTDEFRPHDPAVLSTIQLNGNYDPGAQCPTFLRYLDDVLPATEHDLVQEMLGYFLVPINKAQKAFIAVGKGDSGKSTFLHVVQKILLGPDNVSNLTWQELNEKFATIQLFGKLANVFADLPAENLKDTGPFKAITGEDYISGQYKFKDYFSFKPFVALLFSCNLIPKNFTDRSDGFYRRLIILLFNFIIPEEKRDPDLKDKLEKEVDGILAWSLIGLKRLMENKWKFSETARTRAALADYRRENSSVLVFADECCVRESGVDTSSAEAFRVFKEFIKENNLKPVGSQRFKQEMVSAGFVHDRDSISRRHIYRDMRLLA